MKYQVKIDIRRGVMQHYYKRSFRTAEEAISCIESIAEGDYTIEVLNHFPACVLHFSNCKIQCNFDPEEDDPQPQYIMFEEDQRPQALYLPSDGPVKSRMVNLHDIACEALGVHVYLDMKRLRHELRQRFPGVHQRQSRWEWDYKIHKERIDEIKRVVLELEDKPRRNRKKAQKSTRLQRPKGARAKRR